MARQPRRGKQSQIRRGDVIVGTAKGDFFGRPRPCVVVQADLYDQMDSVLVCPLTSKVGFGHPMRVRLQSAVIGSECDVQVDKLIAVPRRKANKVLVHLLEDLMREVDAALLLLLDLKRYMLP